MKEINTHQVLETKIRIYESWFLKELSDYFEKHKKDYRTKNDFYVSLIRVGLETEKIKDENFADYNGKLNMIKFLKKNVMFVAKLYLPAKPEMESVNIAVGITIDSEK